MILHSNPNFCTLCNVLYLLCYQIQSALQGVGNLNLSITVVDFNAAAAAETQDGFTLTKRICSSLWSAGPADQVSNLVLNSWITWGDNLNKTVMDFTILHVWWKEVVLVNPDSYVALHCLLVDRDVLINCTLPSHSTQLYFTNPNRYHGTIWVFGEAEKLNDLNHVNILLPTADGDFRLQQLVKPLKCRNKFKKYLSKKTRKCFGSGGNTYANLLIAKLTFCLAL